MTKFSTKFRRAGLAAFAGLSLIFAAATAQAQFRGAGALYNFSEGCSEHGWPSVTPMFVRYRAMELEGTNSQLLLFAPNGGGEVLRRRANFAPGSFMRMGGINLWNGVFSADVRPRLRVMTRRVIEPAGASFEDAEVILLRVRLRNFNNLQTCHAFGSFYLAREVAAD